MNKLTSKERRNLTFGLTSCIGMVALASAAVAHNYLTATDRAFEKQYTADGACLNQTVFDLDEGATLVHREVDGQSVLSVLPEHEPVQTPTTLNFTFNENLWSVTFRVADYGTGSFAGSHCGLTEGY